MKEEHKPPNREGQDGGRGGGGGGAGGTPSTLYKSFNVVSMADDFRRTN